MSPPRVTVLVAPRAAAAAVTVRAAYFKSVECCQPECQAPSPGPFKSQLNLKSRSQIPTLLSESCTLASESNHAALSLTRTDRVMAISRALL
jgi:hypothetical protein